MNTQSHYIIPESSPEKRCNPDTPLQVNCAGFVELSAPFVQSSQRQDWYLQVMTEGELQKGGAVCLKKGQFVIHPPDVPYQYCLPEGHTIGYYWIHFTGSTVSALLTGMDLAPGTVYTLSGGLSSSLRQSFSSLFREIMFRQQGYGQMSASLLCSILVQLSRAASTGQSGVSRNRLQASTEYIHEHYFEDLHISELADMEHLCESRYRELFRQAYNTSPSDYIIHLRMMHASELLAISSLTIAEIAQLCGYTDSLYFSRLFHRKNGISPAAYRSSVRKIL